MKSIKNELFKMIPTRSKLINKFAQRYVDRFNGDNNSDFQSNGEMRLLQTILPELRGGVIFDVGANIGEWSQSVLSISPQMKIHLFEPSVETWDKLQERDWPTNVHLNNFGLGREEEKLTLNIFDDASGMNSLYTRQGIEGLEIIKTEDIQIRKADDYCVEHEIDHVDFMKIDVEGHELSVLQGASEMMANKRISLIQFEYGGCNLDARVYLRDLWDIFQASGYRLSKIFPDRLEPIEKYDQRLETFKYSNWVAYTK